MIKITLEVPAKSLDKFRELSERISSGDIPEELKEFFPVRLSVNECPQDQENSQEN